MHFKSREDQDNRNKIEDSNLSIFQLPLTPVTSWPNYQPCSVPKFKRLKEIYDIVYSFLFPMVIVDNSVIMVNSITLCVPRTKINFV